MNHSLLMKTLHSLSSALISASLLFLSIACTPTSGEVGPKGDKGDPGAQGVAGPAGPQGPAGQNGNANVIQFSFGSRVYNPVNSEITYTLQGVTADMIGKSVLLLYLQNTSGYWYPIPGIFDGIYEYRTIIRPSANSTVAVRRTDNTTVTQTFSATRIIIIPASDLRNGRKAAVDYSNYEEVKKHYNLPD